MPIYSDMPKYLTPDEYDRMKKAMPKWIYPKFGPGTTNRTGEIVDSGDNYRRRDNNVTVKAVVMNHIRTNFHMRVYLCRATTKDLCRIFVENGIFQPYITGGEHVIRDTWRIDFEKLHFISKSIKTE